MIRGRKLEFSEKVGDWTTAESEAAPSKSAIMGPESHYRVCCSEKKRFARGRAKHQSLCPFVEFVFACLLVFSSSTTAAPINPDDVRVIDGDTIRLWQKGPDVRLIGFNAPETRRAACVAERELGASARGRLHQLVQHGNLDFEFVACSCPPGAEGTAACNYGRRCGRLKAGNRDVGGILIEEGLAVPFNCGTNRCPRTPRPWCESPR